MRSIILVLECKTENRKLPLRVHLDSGKRRWKLDPAPSFSQPPTASYPRGRLQPTARPQICSVRVLPKPQMHEVSLIPAGHTVFLDVFWRAEHNIQHAGVQEAVSHWQEAVPGCCHSSQPWHSTQSLGAKQPHPAAILGQHNLRLY